MSILPLSEIGVDYEGSDIRNYRFNEVHNFSDTAKRIFMPEGGVYYTESLIVKETSTNKVLVKGLDYDVVGLDPAATANSGKEACGLIAFKNGNITSITIEYRAVGGSHASGFYVLEQMLKMYPQGVTASVYWDDIAGKPAEGFQPAHHAMNIYSFFGFEELAYMIERVRVGLVHYHRETLAMNFDKHVLNFQELHNLLASYQIQFSNSLDQIAAEVQIKDGEYIFTDSAAHPAAERGYGVWERVENTLVHANNGQAYIVGSGTLIGMGTTGRIYNCYVWKRTETAAVKDVRLVITVDRSPVTEGETVTFTIDSDLPSGTYATTVLNQDRSLVGFNPRNVVTLTNGRGTFTYQTGINTTSTSQGNFLFMLDAFPNKPVPFVTLNSGPNAEIIGARWLDNDRVPTQTAGEGEIVWLSITSSVTTDIPIHLNWEGTTVAIEDVTALPSMIISAGRETIFKVRLLKNNKENGTLKLVVRAAASNQIDWLNPNVPVAELLVADTSLGFTGQIIFRDMTDRIITSINEGTDLKVILLADDADGRAVRYEYSTNRPLTNFTGLISSGSVTGNQASFIIGVGLDKKTNTDFDNYLTVSVYDGSRFVASNTIIINDTSKNPAIEAYFARDASGNQRITSADEGTNFHLILKQVDYEVGGNPPNLEIRWVGVSANADKTRFTGTVDGNFALGTVIPNTNVPTEVMLSTRILVNADKATLGAIRFNMEYRWVGDPTWQVLPMTVNDTSRPIVDSWWAKTATSATPRLTTLEEMAGNLDANFHLWVDVDGRLSEFDRAFVKLGPKSTVNAADFVTQFPVALNMVGNRAIVPITIKDDLITEGDEILSLVGYSDAIPDLFENTITVLDNSFSSPITLSFTVDTVYPTPPTNPASEWDNIWLQIDAPGVSFASTFKIEISDHEKLIVGRAVIDLAVPINQSKTLLNVSAMYGRNDWGEHAHTFRVTRYRGTESVSETATTTINFMNDRVEMAVSVIDVARTSAPSLLLTEVPENETFNVSVTVSNPRRNSIVTIGVVNADDVAPLAGRSRLTMPDHSKVLRKYTAEQEGLSKITIPMTIPPDRLDNGGINKLRFTARVDWSSDASGMVVGGTYPTALDAPVGTTAAILTKEYPFIDASPKPNFVMSRIVNGVASSSVDEGNTMTVSFAATKLTDGDGWRLRIDNANSTAGLDAFSSSEFETKTYGFAPAGTMTFASTVINNFNSDGVRTVRFYLYNTATGESITDPSYLFTINDSSKTPSFSNIRWMSLASGGTVMSSVNEGSSVFLTAVVLAGTGTLNVAIERVDGRPLTGFTKHEFNKVVSRASDNQILTWEFIPTADNLVTVAEALKIGVRLKIVEMPTITALANIPINDSSQPTELTVAFREAPDAPSVITAISELNDGVNGRRAYMEMTYSGIPGGNYRIQRISTDATVRPITEFKTSPYGVDIAVPAFTAGTIKVPTPFELLAQSGSQGNRVGFNLVNGATSFGPFYLNIVDNYEGLDVVGNFGVSARSGTTLLTSLVEATNYTLHGNTSKGTVGRKYALRYHMNTLYHPATITAPNQITCDGTVMNFGRFDFNLAASALGSPVANHNYRAEIYDVASGVVLDTINLPVVKPTVIDAIYWSTDPTGTSQTTIAKSGAQMYLFVKSYYHSPTGMVELSFNGSTTPQDQVDVTISGTRQLAYTTVNGSTGYGELVVPFKFVGGPE